MKFFSRFAGLAVLLSFFIAPASAILTSGNPNDAVYNAIGTYGNLYTGVAQVLSGGGGICSGALFGPSRQYVITAAHCVASEATGVPFAASNFSAIFAGQTASQADQAVAVYVNPNFHGTGGTDANDIAVIQLSTPESASINTYSLYQGSVPFGSEVTIAGWAAGGYGTIGPDGNNYPAFQELRVAGNDYNFYSTGDNTHVLFTFESGSATNNAACFAAGFYSGTPGASNNPYSSNFSANCPYATGVGNGPNSTTNFEGSIDPGDSGGPTFYNGQIVGIHSYGTCLTINTPGGYQCLDAGTNPQGPDYNANTLPNTVNFDFGELAGDTNVSLYDGPNGFLAQFSVPEPSTAVLWALGLAVLFLARRRFGTA